MKKLILFLLLSITAFSQNPTNFPYGIKNTVAPTNSTPTYFVTQETDGVHKKTPAANVEVTANKVTTITGYDTTKYPNEKAAHDALDLKLNISDLPTNLTLYPTTTTSDVSGYVVMVKDIHDVRYNTTAVDVSTPTITATDQLVSQRISDAGILIGQPGVFNITTFGNIRRLSGSGTATFYFKVFHRDAAGVETLICTSSISAPVTDGGYSEFTASGVWDDGDFVATDRIVIKSYANRIAGGSDPVYQFQFGGVSPVRTLLPVPFSVVQNDVLHTNQTPETKIGGLKLGNSNTKYNDNWLTFGTSVTNTQYYSSQVALKLNLNVINYGVDGSTSNNLASQYVNIPTLNSGNQDIYRLLSVEHSINDAGTGVSLATYRANLENFIANAKSKNWPNEKILVINGNYCTTAPLITALEPYANEAILIAKEQGVQYFDAYNYTKNNGGGSLLSDGVHPTRIGAMTYARGLCASLQGGFEASSSISSINAVSAGNSFISSDTNGNTNISNVLNGKDMLFKVASGTDGFPELALKIFNNKSISTYSGLTSGGSIIPSIGNTFDIGSPSSYFYQMFTQYIQTNNVFTNLFKTNFIEPNGGNLTFRNDSSSSILATLFNSSGNLTIQTGGVHMDNGVDKLQVNGSGYFSNGVNIPQQTFTEFPQLNIGNSYIHQDVDGWLNIYSPNDVNISSNYGSNVNLKSIDGFLNVEVTTNNITAYTPYGGKFSVITTGSPIDNGDLVVQATGNVNIGGGADNGIDKLQVDGSGYFSGTLKSPKFYSKSNPSNPDLFAIIATSQNISSYTGHIIEDSSIITPPLGARGYGIVDLSTILTGSNPATHFHGYQARLKYNASVDMSTSSTFNTMTGFFSGSQITGTGNVNTAIGFKAHNHYRSGTGRIYNQYGLWIEDQTEGTVSNYGIWNDTYGNYMKGLSIGTTTIDLSNALHVNGTILATSYTGSATLTGTPTAPTATAGTNTTQIATTAFVQSAVGSNVTDAIVDGVTTVAPSQNAVFDALAGKASLSSSPTFTGTVQAAGLIIGGGNLYTCTTGTGLAGCNGSISFTMNHPSTPGWTSNTNIAATFYKTTVYTVATLPTTGVSSGTYATVSDALAPAYLGVLVGGGSVVCPVFYNGTNWVAH